MSNLLIVEDEQRIQDMLTGFLENCGYACYKANDGMDALLILKTYTIDLIILDIMLPNLNGFEVCTKARQTSDIPIIMLTAKDSEEDKIHAYELGADDYVTKPFSPKILCAKINAILRRRTTPESACIYAGSIRINAASHKVFVDDIPIALTYKEYELLLLFVNHPNFVFTRQYLLEKIWKYEYNVDTRTIDTHIKTLRHKLGNAGSYIITLVRSGYKFQVPR